MKVGVIIVSDSLSRRQRNITLRISSIDDKIISDYITLPKDITKTYPSNISPQDIRNDIKQEVTSLIDAVKEKMKNEGLQGKTITFDI